MRAIKICSAPQTRVYAIHGSESSLIDEKFLRKHIPHYTDLSERARAKAVEKLFESFDAVHTVNIPTFLPNAPRKIEDEQGHKHYPTPEELNNAVHAFLRITELFSSPDAGYLITSYTLAGLHSDAIRSADPNIRFAASIPNSSAIVTESLCNIAEIVVPRKRWKGKHYTLRREPILDCRRRHLIGVHIQDFCELNVQYREHTSFIELNSTKIKLSLPNAYVDTLAVIVGADSAFLREASPFLDNCTTFLIGCGSNDWGAARLTSQQVAEYDPTVLEQLNQYAAEIASMLRLWWEHDGDEIEDEYVWTQEIVADAKASFGRPDSRYIAVTLDPRKLRDAVAYRFFLSFLDFCVRRGWLTEEETVPYRTGAEAVFDPKPVSDKPLRRMEQPEVFREIMETLIMEYSDKIIPLGQPFVKAAKSFGAYREIGGKRFLIMLEADWAIAYLKAARKAGVDVSFAQRPNWERDLQKLLCEAEAIKSPSAGFRYRYDLFGNGTRDKTYVVAYPSLD